MSIKLKSLSIFFPAFNEAANLPHLIQEANQVIPNLAEKYEIIVVDDGSTDSTQDVVNNLQSKSANVRLISHDKNQGYGAALKTGIASCQMDWIFFTDADRQFHLEELSQFLPFTDEYQAIIGWRIKRADPAHRARNAKLFKIFIDLLFRLHVKDIDCAFKLLKRDLVQSIELESSGAFTTSELLYKLKKRGVKFKELPVSHYPRQFGNQTGANLKVILKAGWEALSLYVSIKIHKWFGYSKAA